MKIVCAKTGRPLGVRGRGEGGFVFCPDPLARVRNGNRKKYVGTKVMLGECQECDHYRGEHKTMMMDLVYQNPLGDKDQLGVRKIVLRAYDAEKQKIEDSKWEKEEHKNGGK